MDVYFCSTYYHVLISCLKSLAANEKPDLVILNYIKDSEALATRIKDSQLFNSVKILKTPSFVLQKNLFEKLFTNKLYKNRLKNFQFPFDDYKNIYLYMDDTWIARYCKLEHIRYHLIEDSVDAFKYILNNRFRELVKPEYNRFHKIYKLFPYAEGNHKHFLDSAEVIDIEVNEIKGTIFEHKEKNRLIEVPRTGLFNLLKNKDLLNKVLDVFLDNKNIIDGDNIAIIFTSPFFDDKFVNSEEEQLKVYNKLIKKYDDFNILVKAHPRDATDYAKLENVRVIPKNFPSELIAYLDQSKIMKYISIASHSVDIYPMDKVDFYELDEVKQWD